MPTVHPSEAGSTGCATWLAWQSCCRFDLLVLIVFFMAGSFLAAWASSECIAPRQAPAFSFHLASRLWLFRRAFRAAGRRPALLERLGPTLRTTGLRPVGRVQTCPLKLPAYGNFSGFVT